MVDDSFQPLSAPSIAGQHTAIEMLEEYASTTQDGIAPEPARDYRQMYTPIGKSTLSRSANISALNTSAHLCAVRMCSQGLPRPRLNLNALPGSLHFIY